MLSLIERIKAEATPPCVGCEWNEICEAERLSCPASFSYVQNGYSTTPFHHEPTRELYILEKYL